MFDPRIPKMPGRSMSGFHRPGLHCLRQPRNAVGCSASRITGVNCILLTTASERDFGTLCALSCIWTTASTGGWVGGCRRKKEPARETVQPFSQAPPPPPPLKISDLFVRTHGTPIRRVLWFSIRLLEAVAKQKTKKRHPPTPRK